MLPAIGIVIGLFVGYAAGGRLGALPQISTSILFSLGALSIGQGIARGRLFGTESSHLGMLIWGVAALLICVVVFRSTSVGSDSSPGLTGLTMVLVGTLLNVSVVLLNQGMPAALVENAAARIEESAGFYIHLNGATIMPFLADVMIVETFLGKYLLSAGDVLLLTGVAIVLIELMIADKGRGESQSAITSG